MSHYKTIKALGTPHVVYQGLIDFLDDFELAAMLSHLLYWSDKTDNPLGVYRSNDEWYELYRFKDAKVKSLSDKLQERGLIKKTYKRLEHRMYYLLDVAEFDRQYEIFANQQNDASRIAKIEIGEQQKIGLADGENQDSLYTKITTKNTTKNTTDNIYTHDENSQENSQTSTKTKKTSSAKKFTKPSFEQVRDYFAEQKHNNPSEQASIFLDYYDSNGWKVGRNPMKDWQATVRNWIKRDGLGQQRTWPQQSKPNRMAEFAEQSRQWGDDFYSQQPAIGESK